MDFQNLIKLEYCMRLIFEILIIHKPSREIPTKNLGPIGSSVFTFIGYKQTNGQAKFIYI